MLKKIALFLVLLCGVTQAHAALFERRGTDLAAELAIAQQQNKTLAVLFELDDCPSCLAQRKNALSNPTVNAAFAGRFHTLALNLGVDTPLLDPKGSETTLAAFARKIRVFGTPALVFFDANGALITRIDSPLHEPAELLVLGRYVASETYESRPFGDVLPRALPAARKIKQAEAQAAYLRVGKLAGSGDSKSVAAVHRGKPCCDPAKHHGSDPAGHHPPAHAPNQSAGHE